MLLIPLLRFSFYLKHLILLRASHSTLKYLISMLYISFLSHHWASHEGWCQIHVWPHILGGCLGTSNHAIKLGSQVHVRSQVLGGFSGTYNPSLPQLDGHVIGRPNFPAPRDPKMPKIMTGNGWLTLFLSGVRVTFGIFWYFLVFSGALLPKTCVFFFALAATGRLHTHQNLVPYHTGAYSITTKFDLHLPTF